MDPRNIKRVVVTTSYGVRIMCKYESEYKLRKAVRQHVKTTETVTMLANQQIIFLPSRVENFIGNDGDSYVEQINCYMFLHGIP